MKKLLLIATVGIFFTGCGTKESSMSTNNTDSTAVDSSINASRTTTDTVSSAMPDSIKMKLDSANTVK
jgi:hypothetical protein